MSRVTAPIKVGSAVYIRRVTHGYPVLGSRYDLRGGHVRKYIHTYVRT